MISYGLYRLLPFLYEEELIQRHADVFVVGSIRIDWSVCTVSDSAGIGRYN